ncbi:MAG TPA: hypothetical protein VFI17_07335 [Solirubrobacterales bacterium]|nr:hypothetical protein [Solirubrobacterales bacterium]
MASNRAVDSKFTIGATVENAGVKPRAASEEDVADLDRRLRDLLHRRRTEQRQRADVPAAAEQPLAQPDPR